MKVQERIVEHNFFTKKLIHNKRQEHINGINHDIKFLEEELNRHQVCIWWMGEKYSFSKVRSIVKELKEELQKVESDKTYKPWK